jgi:hypothetical protein
VQLRSLICSISTLGCVPDDRVISLQARAASPAWPLRTLCIIAFALTERAHLLFPSFAPPQLVYNDSVEPDYEPPGFLSADPKALVRSARTRGCKVALHTQFS